MEGAVHDLPRWREALVDAHQRPPEHRRHLEPHAALGRPADVGDVSRSPRNLHVRAGLIRVTA